MEIRAAESLDEIEEAVALFARIWHAPERELPPRNLLRALTAHSNLLIGCYDPSLIGAVLGWWGRDPDGSMFLFSQKLCVAPEHRGTGIARDLKQAQAIAAAERGVSEIRWTFDPMRSLNAAFNLRTLRAVGVALRRDLYGPRADQLNAGERTDRMMVSWRPSSKRPPSPGGEQRHVALPASYDGYRALAERQRAAERDRVAGELQAAFADGFLATGFERPGTYVMERIA